MSHSKENPSGGIDDNLRKVFQSTLDEEVPDRFKDLLEQLQAQEPKDKSEGDRT